MSAQTTSTARVRYLGATPPIRGAVAGILTALFALGIAELLASLIDDQASPIVAVGSAAIDATPEWLKSFAIRTFGSNDKVALMVGMVVVIAHPGGHDGHRVDPPAVDRSRRTLGLRGVGSDRGALNRPTGSLLSVIPSIVRRHRRHRMRCPGC